MGEATLRTFAYALFAAASPITVLATLVVLTSGRGRLNGTCLSRELSARPDWCLRRRPVRERDGRGQARRARRHGGEHLQAGARSGADRRGTDGTTAPRDARVRRLAEDGGPACETRATERQDRFHGGPRARHRRQAADRHSPRGHHHLGRATGRERGDPPGRALHRGCQPVGVARRRPLPRFRGARRGIDQRRQALAHRERHEGDLLHHVRGRRALLRRAPRVVELF